MQQAAELSVPAPTIEAALDGRFLSGLKDQRVEAAKLFQKLGATEPKPEPVSSPSPDQHVLLRSAAVFEFMTRTKASACVTTAGANPHARDCSHTCIFVCTHSCCLPCVRKLGSRQ